MLSVSGQHDGSVELRRVNNGRQVAVASKLYTLITNISGPSVRNVLHVTFQFGTYKFKVAPTFVENLCNPAVDGLKN